MQSGQKTKLTALLGLTSLMVLLAVAPTTTLGARVKGDEAMWCYSGECGAKKWAELTPSWRLCGMGESQSPIDIRADQSVVDVELQPLHFQYNKAVSCQFFSRTPSPLVRGRELELKAYSKAGGSIKFNRVEYFFDKATVHVPSEHMVDGEQARMEIQLWHVDSRMQKLRISLLFHGDRDKSRGDNTGLKALIEGVMKVSEADKGDGKLVSATPKDPIDLEQLFDDVSGGSSGIASVLTRDKEGVTMLESYFFYDGSSTTPPCAEDVKWVVVGNAGHISDDQVDALRYALDTSNDRPAQALFKRSVYRRPYLVGTPTWTYHTKAPTGPSTDLSGWLCKNGRHQSPINLEDPAMRAMGAPKGSPTAVFHHAAVSAIVTHYMDEKQSRLKPDKYGLFMEFGPGNKAVLQGKDYKLDKMMIYAPGLHQFFGETLDMEIHLQHSSEKGDFMLAVPVKEGPDSDPIFPKLLTGKGFNPTELLPSDPNYYLYDGSKLTGECDEGVRWVVMQKSITLSSADMAKFFAMMPPTRYRRDPQRLYKRILIKTAFPPGDPSLGPHMMSAGKTLLRVSKAVHYTEE